MINKTFFDEADISSFLSKTVQWAKENDDIRAIILVGSYARGKAREDSDVDLVIISSNPEMYINNNFIDYFGKVKRSGKEYYGRVTSIRAFYSDNNLEVEFGITGPIWVSKPLDQGTVRTLTDGYKVIVDKDNYFKDIIVNLML